MRPPHVSIGRKDVRKWKVKSSKVTMEAKEKLYELHDSWTQTQLLWIPSRCIKASCRIKSWESRKIQFQGGKSSPKSRRCSRILLVFVCYVFKPAVFSFTVSSRLVKPSLPYACRRYAPRELSTVLRSLGKSGMSFGNLLST